MEDPKAVEDAIHFWLEQPVGQDATLVLDRTLDVPLAALPEFIRRAQDLCDRATPATSTAVKTMRLVADSAGQDLDKVARIDGVDLEQATMAELNRIGRTIGQTMPEVTSVGVHLP